MKRIHKILIILALVAIALIFLSNTASAPSPPMGPPDTSLMTLDGMTYRVFTQYTWNGSDVEIVVINVTKEKLEVQKLKAEIEYYKKLR